MRQILITIKRPTGQIEIVDATEKFSCMNDALFAKVKKYTAEGGRGEALSWEEVWTDDRSAAEEARDRVERALAAVEAAENSTCYSPERIIAARIKADKLAAEWAAAYPEAAAARKAAAAAAAAARDERIRNSESYKAAIEGRD